MFPAGKQRVKGPGLSDGLTRLGIDSIYQRVRKIIIFITAVSADIMPVSVFGIGCFIAVRLKLIMMFEGLRLEFRLFFLLFGSQCCSGQSQCQQHGKE